MEKRQIYWLNTSRIEILDRFLKPCVHDQRIWTKLSIQEICNQLTCSFYGKTVILLAKDFLDRKLGPSSLIVDTRLKYRGHKALDPLLRIILDIFGFLY